MESVENTPSRLRSFPWVEPRALSEHVGAANMRAPSLRQRLRSGRARDFNDPSVGAKITLNHLTSQKVAAGRRAARLRIDGRDLAYGSSHLLHVVHQESIPAVLDDLRQSAGAECN